ncbi:MAG: hypothetical protein AB1813_13750 [Verrucomicrobiota bacterium]|jgi:hypothetical protein
MSKRDLKLLILCLVLLGVTGFMIVRQYLNRSDGQTRVFFYDLSEKKLFTGVSTLVPPIKGLNDAEEDAVRAIVISTNGKPEDKSSWKIAYLEMYSPELKQQFERAQREGGSPELSRAQAQNHRFVRRLEDREWYPMSSNEASLILNEWLTAGPGGEPAVICTP